MKKCPYCAEEIQDNAIVCKHCKKSLKEWSIYDPIKKIIKDTKTEIDKIPPGFKHNVKIWAKRPVGVVVIIIVLWIIVGSIYLFL